EIVIIPPKKTAKSQIHYKNDIADGKYTAWYSKAETINGLNALRITGAYKNNLMDGKWVYYDEDEIPVGEANFHQGTGLMTTFHNGEVIRTTHHLQARPHRGCQWRGCRS
ncbi:MAG: hypothetical protein MJZ49_08875, partial [Bacteroidales bacterium]|nr:hypothetical protein [Bacteroidales bacterium]